MSLWNGLCMCKSLPRQGHLHKKWTALPKVKGLGHFFNLIFTEVTCLIKLRANNLMAVHYVKLAALRTLYYIWLCISQYSHLFQPFILAGLSWGLMWQDIFFFHKCIASNSFYTVCGNISQKNDIFTWSTHFFQTGAKQVQGLPLHTM